MICAWCEVNAGKTHATRPCCLLRRLALAPRHVVAAYAAGLTEDERDALRPRIIEEKKRLKGIK